MEKLTVSILSEKKLDWIKAYAKTHEISVGQLFESYITALMAFDQMEVDFSPFLAQLRKAGDRTAEHDASTRLQERRHRKKM